MITTLFLLAALAAPAAGAPRPAAINRARVAASEQMLSHLWVQKVVHDEAHAKEQLAKGFAGSVKLIDGKIIKTVSPTLKSEWGWGLGRAQISRLYQQEVAIQREVNRIAPGLTPKVLDADSKNLAFTMEFVPGKHLNELTRADLSPGALRRFEKQVALVHAAGIGHGDIKPANIMAVGGELKLIDWGASRHTDGLRTVMDRILTRQMGYPGKVDLVGFDQLAMKKVRAAVRALPAGSEGSK
jgi:serine/threonine protein kinase